MGGCVETSSESVLVTAAVTAVDSVPAEQLEALVQATAPEVVALRGVGVEVAGALLVAAGDNPERLEHEASFAGHFVEYKRRLAKEAEANRGPRGIGAVLPREGAVLVAPYHVAAGARPW